LEGIICVNKPKGVTSFDIIRKLRKVLNEKKIGHTGTLDPLATGVIIICLGRATKLVSDIEACEKEYKAKFELGYKTDTYDIEGKTIDKIENFDISRESLEQVLEKFKGKILQVPPMYSAIKMQGKKLYELARLGITVERVPRPVEIKKIDVLSFDGKKGEIDCVVSKGTYIRSLIFDTGEVLGTFATMSGLIRTRVGKTTLESCYSLEEIENMASEENFEFLNSVEQFFKYPRIDLKREETITYFENGNSFSYEFEDGTFSVYNKNEFIGLGIIKEKRLKPYKFF
jgi:tRNA pseudouridine55 synthase